METLTLGQYDAYLFRLAEVKKIQMGPSSKNISDRLKSTLESIIEDLDSSNICMQFAKSHCCTT